MAYVFIDESGDLGFKRTSSKWFIFAMAVVPDERPIKYAVKKVRQSLREKRGRISELHAHSMNESIRKRMFRAIGALQNIKILSVVLQKSRLPDSSRKDTSKLYARIARMLIVEFIIMKIVPTDEILYVIVDRKDTNEKIKKEFLSHVREPLEIAGFRSLAVSLQSSDHYKPLQAIDFISWAIFRKYETGDETFYRLIDSKIVSEEILTIH